jgi:hypothetical protein
VDGQAMQEDAFHLRARLECSFGDLVCQDVAVASLTRAAFQDQNIPAHDVLLSYFR